MNKLDKMMWNTIRIIDYIRNNPIELGTYSMWNYKEACEEAKKYPHAAVCYRVATDSYVVLKYPRK